jgi:hypothetical protein
VVTTADRACSVDVRYDLAAKGVVRGGMTQSAAEPDRLLLSTLLNGGGGEIWTSPDLGLTWTLLSTNAANELYPVLLAAPSDAQRVYAKGYRIDTATSTLTTTWVRSSWVRSSDGGKTWQARDLSTETTPVAVHPSQPDVVFAYEFANPEGTQVHLLRSEDAGDSFTSVTTLTSVTSFAATPDGSELWVGAGGEGGGLYHSTDGGKSFERAHEEFLKVTCLAYHGDELWTCANHEPNLDGIWKLRKGATKFENTLTFDLVRESVACTADAGTAEQVCSVPWLDWELEVFPYDAGAPPLQDAGSTDAAVRMDAGATDAGISVISDGGAAKSRKPAGGCSVSELGASAVWSSTWLVLVGLTALLSRRRS